MRKRILVIIAGICALQVLRIGLKALAFSFVERTLLSDAVFNVAFVSIVSCGLLLGAQPMGCALDILPAKFTKLYGIATLVTAAICISTPFINADFTPYAILALLYGAVLTPLYEDVLFRGWIWEAVRERGDAAAYRISTLLFAFWHLGYIDTILWRTSLFFEDANIPEIMFWKAIIGLVYGIILGAVRYRTRNVYSSMLLHCVMNTIGG